ncbi:hypothetical protein Q5H92_05490 [Hymenobacter sp. M29]|uniref:Uncharacterized protein n=1 Tax=Hymenobacter mellowenesis TaxID=3063995 RepID=A0ABT9A7I5_9BACT|nr:hypothetical protein [Hymenobacter sp. M29]MDO7845801.1 hypothetical protein [Hymenobacter sp. M29]
MADENTDAEVAPESCWTAVANIIRERPYGPGGEEIRFGTNHFAPGAKVYIIDWYGGMCQRIIVVGLHRKSRRYITLTIDVRLVENLRPKVCYDPTVIAKFKEHHPPKPRYNTDYTNYLTKEFAETVCHSIPYWQLNYKSAAETAELSIDEIKFRHPRTFLSRLQVFLGFLLKN